MDKRKIGIAISAVLLVSGVYLIVADQTEAGVVPFAGEEPNFMVLSINSTHEGSTVYEYNSDWDYLRNYNLEEVSQGTGLCEGEDGYFYVVDWGTTGPSDSYLLKYDSNFNLVNRRNLTETVDPPIGEAVGLFQESDGTWWILGSDETMSNRWRVWKFDPSWEYTGTNYDIHDTIGRRANSLSRGNDGYWWVLSGRYEDAKVYKFNQNWEYTGTSIKIHRYKSPIPENVLPLNVDYGERVWEDRPTAIYQDAGGTWHLTGSATDVVYELNSDWSYTGVYHNIASEAFSPQAITRDSPKDPVIKPDKGTIKVNSDPLGATIYVNGAQVGVTPLLVRKSPGTYTIKGTYPERNARPMEKEISLEAGDTVSVFFDFVRPEKHTLTTSVSPPGSGSVSPSSGTYVVGTEVTLTAEPNAGYEFSNWTGDASGTSRKITITMDSDRDITANFVVADGAPKCSLTTEVVGGKGKVVPSSGTYESGEMVKIKAVPADGYSFHSWGGDVSGSENPKSVTMNSDKHITASFDKVKPGYVTLNIGSSPSKGGSVTIVREVAPMGAAFKKGTEVTLEAQPNEGYHFVGWKGSATSEDKTITLVMDEDKQVTATFEKKPTVLGLIIENKLSIVGLLTVLAGGFAIYYQVKKG